MTGTRPVTVGPSEVVVLITCQVIAQLINCLIERELRQAMARREIRELPLYHEQRACTAPTTARVYEQFASVQRHQLTSQGQHLKTFDPKLTELQQQLLNLLDVPASAYTSGPLN
ncbi:hypothetical protein [Conexibacter sp. S30A1]|uniref:hypothetical protein n=1 Tax=Conexibacter sp. S30A1 TaxID=2937800 RepID=UPI00200CBC83|nr:hypothetical protein [Conexibacter sp. S30A1]